MARLSSSRATASPMIPPPTTTRSRSPLIGLRVRPLAERILPPIEAPLTQQLRSAPPGLHGAGDAYFGLAWPALEWLEGASQPGMTTLETGSGASTIVFAASGAAAHGDLTGAEEHERIRDWCERARHLDRARAVPRASPRTRPSHGAWRRSRSTWCWSTAPTCSRSRRSTGSSRRSQLKIGGRVVLDDAFLPSVNVVVRFLRSSPSWEFEGAISYRTVCFRKLDDEVGYDAIGRASTAVPRFGYLAPGRPGGRLRPAPADRSLARACSALLARLRH